MALEYSTTKKLYLIILVFISLSSCSTCKKINKKEQRQENQVVAYSKKYVGFPYRYGGTTPRGFDCSGFTLFVFKHFGYQLPRTSRQQGKAYKRIKRKYIKKGDLVFFELKYRSGRIGHVGIVVKIFKDNTFSFIHASTSKGVVISNSKQRYYKKRYIGASRVIK